MPNLYAAKKMRIRDRDKEGKRECGEKWYSMKNYTLSFHLTSACD